MGVDKIVCGRAFDVAEKSYPVFRRKSSPTAVSALGHRGGRYKLIAGLVILPCKYYVDIISIGVLAHPLG